jgi:hypothetical protein
LQESEPCLAGVQDAVCVDDEIGYRRLVHESP